MGIAPSKVLLGIHTFVELALGATIFPSGIAKMDPEEAKKTTGRDKMWKRWFASSNITLAYIGYLGLTKPDLTRDMCGLCGIFHCLSTITLFMAYQDGTVDFKQAVTTNSHLYVTVGFFSVWFGVLQ